MPETTAISAAAQQILDAVAEDELAEAADLCTLLGIPADYARNVAAALAVCHVDE